MTAVDEGRKGAGGGGGQSEKENQRRNQTHWIFQKEAEAHSNVPSKTTSLNMH